ncbi:hypothetical protein JKP88DRAFT_253258 [Tribonema minus]|uniref:Uncharacterized protein n=1 Tax=Tribonema minus TaxID=303371 RepID=A0A836CJW4_9STRA|nr:hypothetical protein JKP88DRAFT_253258 [Tribonema minus]
MSADKNATAAAALIAHMTSDPTLDPADRDAVNAAIFHWASEQVQVHARYKALLAEGRQGDAAQVRADNGGFVNGAATLESVITKARRTLPEGSAWARHCYAPALTTMVNDASAARVDCASPSRLEYCTSEIIGGPLSRRNALITQMPRRSRWHLGARRQTRQGDCADVNRAEARMLNRMESTPLLRKFKSAFLDHFKHRQRAGINLMRTLYATEMTKGSQRSLVDTARVLCHRPVRHAARHYDLIRAVEADTSEPAAAELEPVCSPCATLATAQDDTVADTLSDAAQDEHVPTRAVNRQKTAPAMHIEDAVTVVTLALAERLMTCAGEVAAAVSLVMPSPVGHDVAWQRRLEVGAPSKRPRHQAPLPHLCDDLVRRTRREGRQISEHHNAEYHPGKGLMRYSTPTMNGARVLKPLMRAMPTLYLSPDRAELYCVRRSPCSLKALVLVCHGGDAAPARVHHSWRLLGATEHETSKRRGIAQRCVRTAAAVTVFTHPGLASASRARYAYLRLQQAMPSQAAEPRQQSTPVSTASWPEDPLRSSATLKPKKHPSTYAIVKSPGQNWPPRAARSRKMCVLAVHVLHNTLRQSHLQRRKKRRMNTGCRHVGSAQACSRWTMLTAVT